MEFDHLKNNCEFKQSWLLYMLYDLKQNLTKENQKNQNIS